jgi:hypothetical protein
MVKHFAVCDSDEHLHMLTKYGEIIRVVQTRLVLDHAPIDVDRTVYHMFTPCCCSSRTGRLGVIHPGSLNSKIRVPKLLAEGVENIENLQDSFCGLRAGEGVQ